MHLRTNISVQRECVNLPTRFPWLPLVVGAKRPQTRHQPKKTPSKEEDMFISFMLGSFKRARRQLATLCGCLLPSAPLVVHALAGGLHVSAHRKHLLLPLLGTKTRELQCRGSQHLFESSSRLAQRLDQNNCCCCDTHLLEPPCFASGLLVDPLLERVRAPGDAGDARDFRRLGRLR